MPNSEKELAEIIRKRECTTKGEILKRIEKKIYGYIAEMDDNPKYPENYYKILLAQLMEFMGEIKRAVLFDELQDFWIYDLDYQYDVFSLMMEHVCEYNMGDDLKYRSHSIDAAYALVTLKSSVFTTEEYASVYEVEEGTVRQWIRRGKIRTAYKEDGEWKIPRLSPPPARGYEWAQYKWLKGIDDLPEEYAYLADYRLATLYQDRKDKKKYHVLLVAKETLLSHTPEGVDASKNKELLMDAQEREKLEHFMIEHPQIKYCGIVI